MGQDTVQKVRDGSEHPEGGPGRIGIPSGWSRTGQDTLREVWKGSGHPDRGPGRVGTP